MIITNGIALIPDKEFTNSSDRFRMNYLTPQEFADALKISLKTVYRNIQTENIRAVRVGRQLRIRADELKRLERSA